MGDRDIHERAADAGERHPEAAPHHVDPTTTGGGLGEPAVGDLAGADYVPPDQRGPGFEIEQQEHEVSPGRLESARDSDPRATGTASEQEDAGPVGLDVSPSLADRMARSTHETVGDAVHDGGGTGKPSDRVDARASVEGRRALDTEGPDPTLSDRVRNPGEG